MLVEKLVATMAVDLVERMVDKKVVDLVDTMVKLMAVRLVGLMAVWSVGLKGLMMVVEWVLPLAVVMVD